MDRSDLIRSHDRSSVLWLRLLMLTLVPYGMILLLVDLHKHLRNQQDTILLMETDLGLRSVLLELVLLACTWSVYISFYMFILHLHNFLVSTLSLMC